MKIKKTLLLSIPAIALAMGAVTFTTLANKTNEAVATHAAEYSRSSRSVTKNLDNSINAKFNVTDNDLTMNGWLLCLLDDKPVFDLTTRKLDNSNNYHPYANTNVKHYFFASSTAKTGEMNVTWAANSADQKEAWSASETAGAAEKTLADYLDDQDWYVVIGLRHTANYGQSGDFPIGEGKDDIWENCDYYLGRYSNLFGNCPEGETYLDLTESSFWKDANAKFAVYYWDNDSHNAFSSFAVSDNGYYIASYELDFVPTNMKAVRFNSTATVPDWNYKWDEGENNTFYEHGVIGIYEEGENLNKSWSDGLAELDGLDETIVLDHYKRNTSNKSEHYNERVTLNAGDEFTVSYKGNPYYSFSAHSSLMEEDNEYFEVKNEKIHVNKGGEFALYFNTDSTVRKLYITKVDIAAADEWSLAFLGENCTDTMNGWETSRTKFNKLSDGARHILESIEHEPDPTKVLSGYPEQAVQRYDHVLISHPGEYVDFMGRINSGKLTLANYHSILAMNGNNAPIIIIVISLLSVGLLGSFFVIKKKKHN